MKLTIHNIVSILCVLLLSAHGISTQAHIMDYMIYPKSGTELFAGSVLAGHAVNAFLTMDNKEDKQDSESFKHYGYAGATFGIGSLLMYLGYRDAMSSNIGQSYPTTTKTVIALAAAFWGLNAGLRYTKQKQNDSYTFNPAHYTVSNFLTKHITGSRLISALKNILIPSK